MLDDSPQDATGLPRGVFTLAASKGKKTKRRDATGLSRGVSRLLLAKAKNKAPGCHGLAPWSLTLAANKAKK